MIAEVEVPDDIEAYCKRHGITVQHLVDVALKSVLFDMVYAEIAGLT